MTGEGEQTRSLGIAPEKYTGIVTHENVTIQYENAGVATRFAAGVIDTLIRAAFWVVVGLIAVLVFDRKIDFDGDILELIETGMEVIVIVYMSMLLLRIMYFTVLEACFRGRTPGKKAMGICVVSVTGEAPSFSQILVRNLMRFFHMIPGGEAIDGVVAIMSKKCQRTGDMVAGTMVIKVRKISGLDELLESAGGNAETPDGTAGTDGADNAEIMYGEDGTNYILAGASVASAAAAVGATPTVASAQTGAAAPTAASGAPAAPAAGVDTFGAAGSAPLPPGAFLTPEEVEMLHEYVTKRRLLSTAREYDTRMLNFVLGKLGETRPEAFTDSMIPGYLDKVYLHQQHVYAQANGGDAGD